MVCKLLRVPVLAGLSFAVGCSSYATLSPSGAAPARRAPSDVLLHHYIKHVIVIIQENRSFENLFAGYPGADAPMTGCAKSAAPAHTRSGMHCPNGETDVPLHQVTFKNNPDLAHNWSSSMHDWDNGKMDGFSEYGKKGKDEAYAYLERSEIAPYWTMANQYVLADKMFPTEFGGSFTAHLTLIAGTDDLVLPSEAEVNFPNAAPDDCDSPPGTKSAYLTEDRKVHYTGPFPCFDQFNTIAEVLDRAGASWKIYATRVLDGGFWEPFEAIKYVRYGPDWPGNIIAPQTRVLTDITSGRLASVSWVTPSYADSDHPAHRSDQGPSWVASIVNAVGQSSYWSTSAIVILWDDWGGFYDNAKPPQLDYRGLGIRVPCLIVSPYAKTGHVSDVRYEYGSILRFIEEANEIPAGSIGPIEKGYTDARASGLQDAFDFTQRPRKFSAIPSKYSRSYFLREPPSNDPVDAE